MLYKSKNILLFLFSATLLSAEDWKPPEPEFNGMDWIQLTSGEWLTGELKSMQDDKLEFDSEEMDLQEFDWEDVAVVRTSRLSEVRVGPKNKEEILIGTLLLKDDQMLIRRNVEDPPTRISRSTIVGLAPGGQQERDRWTIKASLGATMRTGNSEQVDMNTRLMAKRITASTRLNFDYLGSYSETDQIETSNNHRVESQFDIWMNQDFFLRIPFLEYRVDPFQNLEHRLSLGVGIGYEILDTAKTDWNVAFGPAYQFTEFESVEEGRDRTISTGALVLSSDFEHELTDTVTFHSSYIGQLTSKRAGTSSHHLEGRFEIELTSRLDLDFSAIYDLTTSPTNSGAGESPDKSDLRFVTTIGYEY